MITSDTEHIMVPTRRALLGLFLALPATAQGLTEAQRAEVLAILRRALAEDPTILRDALAAMDSADQAASAETQRRTIRAQADALLRDAADPVRGNASGAITIVEFFDARCSYCRAMHQTLEEMLRRNRDVRLVLKDMPILGPNSVLASRAMLAAQRQGKYLPLHDALMRLREEVNEAVLRREAERLGLDWPRLRREMDDPAIARKIEANLGLARALDIQGTPALVIGDIIIPGAMELAQLEAAIVAMR
jgi:protein-disulfide isomerase